jgi:hypothetical protein
MGSVIQQLFHACYASCTAGSIFTIYQYNGGSPAATGLYIDVHCETTGLQYSFLMTGAATKTFGYVLDLSFQDLSNEAASSIFAIDPGSSLTSFELRHVRLNVFPTGPGTTASLFDVPSKWSVRAEFAALYAGLGAPLPALWTGPVMNLNAPASSFETLYKWASTARPTSVPSGTIGYATDTNRFEVYDGTSWFNHLRTSGDTMTGQLNVGTGTASAAIALVGPTASQRRIDFYTAASLRWRFTANNTAESSTAAGSDLNLQSFDNTGASIGFPLIVERATGITTLTSLKVSGNSGFNNTAPIAKPTVSGAKGSNAALASLLTALVAYGLVTDSTSA